MNKYVKWAAISIAGLIALIAIISISLYFFLPLNKIKDFAAAKLSEQIHREVKIDGVSFNLFSGIKLKGLTISNRKGFDDRPFISASAIELRYAFWPLFQGKVIIPEATLVKPQIIIEKSRGGDFNFSDMFGPEVKTVTIVKKSRRGKKIKEVKIVPIERPKPASSSSIDLIINTFAVKQGKIVYIDYAAGSENELKDLNIKISNITLAPTMKMSGLALLTPVSVKASAIGTYQGKDVPISLSGSINMDLASQTIKIPDLLLSIAGQSLSANVNVQKGSNINLSLASDQLALDPFLAIFASAPSKEKKGKQLSGSLTQSLKSTFSSVPKDLVVTGNADLKKVTLSQLTMDSLKFSLGLKRQVLSFDIKEVLAYNGKFSAKGVFNLPALSYNIGALNLSGLTAAPLLNDLIDSFLPDLLDMKNKVEGKLDVSASLKGSGVEMPAVFDNLSASGIILLADGRLKKIRSLESIGEKYNLNLLKQDMLVRGLRLEGSMANKKLAVKNLSVQNTDVSAYFTGGLDFAKGEYVSGNQLTLKFSPDTTKDLPHEISVFKDEKGLVSVDFELQGSLSKPIPVPKFEKPIEAAVGKLKVKIEAKKVEIETKADAEKKRLEEEAKQKASQDAERLKEEAKNKVKEILKF